MNNNDVFNCVEREFNKLTKADMLGSWEICKQAKSLNEVYDSLPNCDDEHINFAMKVFAAVEFMDMRGYNTDYFCETITGLFAEQQKG